MTAMSADASQELYSKHVLSGARSIRVLCLHPSERFDAPLEATMEIAELPNARREASDTNGRDSLPKLTAYQALSYAWGTAGKTARMSVDGLQVPITPHLEAGLKRIRDHIQPDDILSTRLWCDAVCINQTSVREHSQQVPIMGDIYHLAGRLLVWLGEAPDDHIDGLHHLDSDHRRATFLKVLKNPYFSRRWIIQEIYLPRSEVRYMLYGNSRRSFRAILDDMNSLVPPEQLRQFPLFGYQHQRFQTHKRRWLWQSLSSILLIYRHALCSRPQDRIFALLGLSHPDMLKVDIGYEMSMSELCWKFAAKEISEGHAAYGVLICATITERSSDVDHAKSPSWVPRWDAVREPMNTLHEEAIRSVELNPFNYREETPDKAYDSRSIRLSERQDGLVVRGWTLRPCSHRDDQTAQECLLCSLGQPFAKQRETAEVSCKSAGLHLKGGEQIIYIDGTPCLFVVSSRGSDDAGHQMFALEYCFHNETKEIKVLQDISMALAAAEPCREIRLI